MAANSFTQLSVVAPLTISGSNSVTIDTLWKPSTVTCSAGIVPTANDSLGTLSLDLDFLENRSRVNFIDSQNTVKALTPSITGSLVYGTSALVDLNYLLNQYDQGKQDVLIPGSNISIVGNTISATSSGATQAWVYQHFFRRWSRAQWECSLASSPQ